MRIHRLLIRNYRGVEEREVRFEPLGVTLVQGANEIGKTSLAEAIDILFEHLDSTTKSAVKAIKPVDDDAAGSEVEADIVTGPYHFTYRKRFHKKQETILRIDRPTPASLTGREAHDRARQMLEETIDVVLWKALRIHQGMELQPADLRDQAALSRAIDLAGGSSQAGEREESLVAAARGEYLRYFTETGKEKSILVDAASACAEANARAEALGASLAALEKDIERSATLRREKARLDVDLVRLSVTSRQADARVSDLLRLESEAGAASAKADAAAEREKTATNASEERARLITGIEALRRVSEDCAARLKESAPTLAKAREDHRAAEALERVAAATLFAARKSLVLRQRDRTFRHDELELARLEEREARITQASAQIVTAETVLAAPPVTDELLAAISAAHLELATARARILAGSPRVQIHAHADLSPIVDGKESPLGKGDVLDTAVDREVTLAVPGVVDVTVSAGAGTEGLRAAAAAEELAVTELLAKAGVSDFHAASAARDAQRDARRTVKDATQRMEDDLRDLTREEIQAKIARLRDDTQGYLTAREGKEPAPLDLTEARRLEAEAQRGADDAMNAHDMASRARDRAREALDAIVTGGTRAQAEADRAQHELSSAEQALAAARAAVSDADLATQLAQRQADGRDLAAAAASRSRALTEADPESARTLAANARAAVEGAHADLRKTDSESGAIDGRLQVMGEQGLEEGLDVARAASAQRDREDRRLRAHADAAKLLHETLQAERNEALRARVAPLRDRIEKLGRLVFGPTLRVELADDLSMVGRTLEGVTVPFESLSGGAREQLGLIARLACAMLVSEHGGGPIILDDALGYTDPQRLELMGAVLAQAGKDCQIIVLTCMPDRYRSVGGAHVVRLD